VKKRLSREIFEKEIVVVYIFFDFMMELPELEPHEELPLFFSGVFHDAPQIQVAAAQKIV
jgi:hypothetical protein